MSNREDNDRAQSARDAVQYDIFQRELDRALEGYNAVYSRISMSLVVLGVLLGFMFLGPGEIGFRGAMDALRGKSSLLVRWTKWFYLTGMAWYIWALCRLLYIASHRPEFLAVYHGGPSSSFSEHKLRVEEIAQCSERARYYRGETRDLLSSCSTTNLFIAVGALFYVVAEVLLVRV